MSQLLVKDIIHNMVAAAIERARAEGALLLEAAPNIQIERPSNPTHGDFATNLEFTEPLDANSKMGKFLAEEGPGVYHIAFGVDDVRGAAKELADKGNKLRGENGITQSAEGYFTANIDPESALGFPFQLAE